MTRSPGETPKGTEPAAAAADAEAAETAAAKIAAADKKAPCPVGQGAQRIKNCHCEPVRRLVWQSVLFSFRYIALFLLLRTYGETDSHASTQSGTPCGLPHGERRNPDAVEQNPLAVLRRSNPVFRRGSE